MKLLSDRSRYRAVYFGFFLCSFAAICLLFKTGAALQQLLIRNGYLDNNPFFSTSLLIPSAMVAIVLTLWWQIQQYRVRRAAVRANFSGLLPNKTVRKLELVPSKLEGRARERVMTVMFVDMAGFSLAAEGQAPKELFAQLQKYANFIQSLVHRYGGTVEKIHGDGVVCYFGYDFLAESVEDEHANRAVKCAMAIQRASLRWGKRNAKKGLPVYPLRIGINTGSVVIGDIGNGERYDFTVIGHGVNYAKRMEQCCDHFKIMISSTTRELLKSRKSQRSAMNKKYVQIKHVEELREAYEIDPLADCPKDVERAMSDYRKHLGIDRKQERFSMGKREQVEVYTDYGSAKIVDHSFSGLGITLNRYLANGCEITLRLDSSDPVSQSLISYGIHEIVGEVRWAGAVGKKGFQHGLAVKNLSDRQLSVLNAILTNVGGRNGVPIAS